MHDGYALTVTWDREGPLKRLRERSGLSVWDVALIVRGADFFTTSSALVAAEEGKPVGVYLSWRLWRRHHRAAASLPPPGKRLRRQPRASERVVVCCQHGRTLPR
jgi:hypothetical protein